MSSGGESVETPQLAGNEQQLQQSTPLAQGATTPPPPPPEQGGGLTEAGSSDGLDAAAS